MLEVSVMRMVFVIVLALLVALPLVLPVVAQENGWIEMFDGETLDGWKPTENPEGWTVENGEIVGRGPRSHLFWMEQPCRNCEFMAEVRVSDGGNSGMYFRAEFMTGWPNGYEAQVNSTDGDPRRTGSLYSLSDIEEQLVPPDTWFTQHIIADGNHITISVNGETVVDYTDAENQFTEGYLALQQHDAESEVHYRNLRMRPLD
jgi:hypothetical protein